MTLIYLLLFNILFIQKLISPIPKYNSPVDIPLYISGNFGELRMDHFHSGIDIKTGGVSLKKVYSVEQGYISRIKIQTNGYGKSLYINHPGGYTSVYGHLDSYNETIDEYVKEIQYNRKSYSIDVFPDKNALLINRGEFIALSGNSGSSDGPHLHFELRKSGTQKPVNPLKYGFEVKDRIPPRITSLFVYKLDSRMQINDTPVEYRINKLNGIYGIPASPVNIEGYAGFGVEINDYLDDSPNPCGIYTIELSIDNKVIYLFKVDEFSFDESRYVNAHVDFALEVLNNRQVHLLFRKPNNRLSMYPLMINDGKFNFQPNVKYPVIIRFTDDSGNESRLEFEVDGGAGSILSENKKPNDKLIFNWDTNNYFENSNVRLEIPKGALYEKILFDYARIFAGTGLYPYIHYIGNISNPLHLSSNLSINADMIPDSLRKYTVFLRLIENKDPSSMEGTWNGDWISSQILNFGKYTLGIDTIPPEIIPLNLVPGDTLISQEEIQFKVTDNLSGIEEYKGILDNSWALFEYDPKNEMVLYKFDKKRMKNGISHKLELSIKDAVGNQSDYHCGFFW